LSDTREERKSQVKSHKKTTMYPRIIENSPFTTFTRVIHKVILSFTPHIPSLSVVSAKVMKFYYEISV
jgi:hypothetical protein